MYLIDVATTIMHYCTDCNPQGILTWQEGSPGPETKHFTALLGRTIQLYLSRDFNDQNVFKILRFLASGFNKVSKLEPYCIVTTYLS